MKKTSEFTGKSSKMKGKYQKKKENTWETQKTKKIPKKNKKNSKINLAPLVCISFGGSAVRDVFSLEDPRWMAKGSRDGNRLVLDSHLA